MSAILFVTQSSSRGGVVTVLDHTLTHWPESDGRKLVLAYNRAHGGKPVFRALANQGVTIEEIPVWDHMAALANPLRPAWSAYAIKLLNRIAQPFLFIQAVLYFRRLCREQDVEVMFSHNGGYPGGMLNRAAVLGGRLARVRRICMVIHNLARPAGSALAPAAWLHDRMIFRAVSDLVAVSEACADVLKANRFVSKEIKVIYNGIPVRSAKQMGGSGKARETFLVAYVGELSERKGLDVLFRSLAFIKPPVSLVLYGKGSSDYETRLRELSTTLGIEDRVAFMGFDPDAAAKLSGADVLVLPSVAYESFGMVLLEAMRQKKPVIVTDVGGMKEVVVDGETGFVVPAGDAAALAAAIEKLVRNASMASAFGESGYHRLQEKFSSETMINHYLALAH